MRDVTKEINLFAMEYFWLLLVLSYFIVVGAQFDSRILDEPTHNTNISSLNSRALPTGTCNAQTPCPIAACCGTNGLCGFSPSECGSGNCTSKCDSKADCGQFGVAGKQKCPLNVCCSQFGFVLNSYHFPWRGCSPLREV